MKKITSSIVIFFLLCAMSLQTFAVIPSYGEENSLKPTANYSVIFSDVPKTYWAFSYIMEMQSRGVLNGYPNGKFYPDNTITRAEFSKIMCLAAGKNVVAVDTTSYVDVSPYEWYARYIEAAKYYLSGYVSGNTKYYYPDKKALREDIAVAMVKLKGYDTSNYDESILKTMFKDYQSISQNARKYVAIAVERGLISGYEDDTFRGQDTLTRAEAATLLWRAYQYGDDNKVFEKEEIEEPKTETKTETKTEAKTEPKPENTTSAEKEEPSQKEPELPTVPKASYSCNTVTKASVSDSFKMTTTDYNDNLYYYDSDENAVYQVNMSTKKKSKLLDVSNLTYDDVQMVETEIVKEVPKTVTKTVEKTILVESTDSTEADTTKKAPEPDAEATETEIESETDTAEGNAKNSTETEPTMVEKTVTEEVEETVYETVYETITEEKVIGTYKDFKVYQLYYNTGNNKLLLLGQFKKYSSETSLEDKTVSYYGLYEINGKSLKFHDDYEFRMTSPNSSINRIYEIVGNFDDGRLIAKAKYNTYYSCGSATYGLAYLVQETENYSCTKIASNFLNDHNNYPERCSSFIIKKANDLYSYTNDTYSNGVSRQYKYSFSKQNWEVVTEAKVHYVGYKNNYFYYWDIEKGKIAKSDLNGKISYIKDIDTINDIDILDFLNMPAYSNSLKAKKMHITNNESFIFYDDAAKAFRIIEKQ